MTRRRTRQGTAIFTAIQTAGRPLAPQEILEEAGRHVDSLSQATVYRQIRRLVADGTIREVILPGMPARYELDPAAAEPDHATPMQLEAPSNGSTGPLEPGPARATTAPCSEHGASGHHHFFHCETCDAVFPVEGCSGDVEQLAPANFTVRRHEVVLYGRCDECNEDAETDAA